MTTLPKRYATVALVLVGAVLLVLPVFAFAHCDTLEGPVVSAARAALERDDIAQVLRWVRPADEAEIRTAFARTLTVRAPGGSARDLADRWFFETVVRIHRLGEGAPYTGLKSGEPGEPGIAMADEAVDHGSADTLATGMGRDVERGIRDRFARVVGTRKHADESVAAGRAYVAAYVEFIHYVEGLHRALAAAPPHAAPGHPAPEHAHP